MSTFNDSKPEHPQAAAQENHLHRFRRWLEYPHLDTATREELERMKDNPDKIKDHFSMELEFGTAGMRGILGPGSNRFNRYIVRRATQGLAQYLLNTFSRKENKVVLAYDSRHLSREAAEEASLVLAANGIKALLFEDIRPVSVLSFAIRHTGAAGGIVITASHNPPEYNGYKVYSQDGGQCVPSTAKKIVEHINKIDIFDDVYILSREEAEQQNLFNFMGEEIDRAYLENLKTLCTYPGNENLRVVYTPLHGSGHPIIPRVLNELGYQQTFLVEEQLAADPDFSTVNTPNPEDPASFHLALKLAEEKDAHLVLATDPDCDRVGCGVKNNQGSYTLLNGNQIGALLLNYRLEKLKQSGELSPNCTMIKTIVTGDLGKKIAKDYGVKTEETLTGFKFIGEKIKEYEQNGSSDFIFGYEESYGYLAGTFSRDKDGVITSALLVEMASCYLEKGLSLLDKLEELYHRYGYHLDELESIKLKDMALVSRVLNQIKNNPPHRVGDARLSKIHDYQEGKARDWNTGEETRLELPQSPTLCFLLEDESWFCIRPSGTEPKLKIYYSTVGENKSIARKKMNALQAEVKKRVDTLD